jgi:hypothetical protein
VDERVLLPVGDPDLAGPGLPDRAAEVVPVAWSEITRGSSTPFCRARARTRIQPDAKQVTGSGKRRDQRSCIAEGGQITMAPASFDRSAATTRGVSPRGMPSLL